MNGLEEEEELRVGRLLQGLNERQRESVSASFSGRLQIIAGPGTGKTTVLASRVGYLVLKGGLEPENIVVTTFTKKAANEMVERLENLLQGLGVDVGKIVVGTFHSICFRIVRKYGGRIGFEGFTVADERDSSQILREVVKSCTINEVNRGGKPPRLSEKEDELRPLVSTTSSNDSVVDEKKVRRQISKLKSAGIDADTYKTRTKKNELLSKIYSQYQHGLQMNKLLDFDDCLLVCYRLISTFPVLNFVQHVLVDEFQDTNDIQLKLMYKFAEGHPSDERLQHNITVVGDPDQSIYAFRDARAKNFAEMKRYYEELLPSHQVQTVALNQNYRSTPEILQFSEKVMRQQDDRISKSLESQMELSIPPLYAKLEGPEQEARWISYQIQYISNLPHKLFTYSDIAVLVRSASQTRCIENEFVKRRIPYEMVKGRAFWSRKEVLAIIDYLKVVSNNQSKVSFLRTINYPKRGIGEKTLGSVDQQLTQYLNREHLSEILISGFLESLVNSNLKCDLLTAKCKQTLKEYLAFIRESRMMVRELDSKFKAVLPAKILAGEFADDFSRLFDYIYENSGLKKELNENRSLELNVLEVKRQLCEFVPSNENFPDHIGASSGTDEETSDENILTKFITSIGLNESEVVDKSHGVSSEVDKEQGLPGQVSISTIHGSKGLEWNIVFVPGLSEGLLPAKFAMDSGDEDTVNEERRCFYVATTRAKLLLFLSSYTEKATFSIHNRTPVEQESRFIKKLLLVGLLNTSGPAINSWSQIEKLYSLLDKPVPDRQSFDLSKMTKVYNMLLKAFLRGEETPKISSHYNQVPGELENDPSFSFASARTHLATTNAMSEPKITKSRNKDTKGNEGQTTITSFFSQPSIFRSREKLQASTPALHESRPNRAPDITKVEIKRPKNNKAPTYIPVRKVPAHVLNKRKPNNK